MQEYIKLAIGLEYVAVELTRFNHEVSAGLEDSERIYARKGNMIGIEENKKALEREERVMYMMLNE